MRSKYLSLILFILIVINEAIVMINFDFNKIGYIVGFITIGIAIFGCIFLLFDRFHCKIDRKINKKYCKYFEQKQLLKPREVAMYKLLYEILHEEYGDRYIVFSQVRMRDIVDLKSDLPWNKRQIINPHYGSVDFLIVDYKNNLKPLIAIELSGGEGSPHEYEDQIEKDEKKKDLINMTDIVYKMFENNDERKRDYVYNTVIPIMEEIRRNSKDK